MSSNEQVNYYEDYKNKYCNANEDLKDKLIEFRKERSKEMNIPAYYIFTNEELDKIIELNPKTIEKLSNILNSIKIKTHGKEIINILAKIE